MLSRGESIPMLMPENETSEQEGFIVDYLNKILSHERLIQCPIVRTFLKFDKGEKHNPKQNKKQKKEDYDVSTLNCRRTISYWKQDQPEENENAKEEKKEGLNNLKRSFYFGDAMDVQDNNNFDEVFQ